MTNMYSDVIRRLELLQNRLLINEEINKNLSVDFSVRFQKNFNYLQNNFSELFGQLLNYKIKNKKVVCFENGEANLLDLRNGTLLYNESPIEQTKEQIDVWLNGKNSYIKAVNAEQTDPFCQLHFYTQNIINNDINNFIEDYPHQPKFSDHQIYSELPSIIINGGGLGYPLLELCSRIEPKFIFYIEPDMEIFLCSLGVIDWESILTYLKNNEQEIFFIIGNDGNESYKIYHQQIELHYPFLQAYQLCYSHYNSQNTDKFMEYFKKSVTYGYNSNGMFDDCLFGINNIISNTQKSKYIKINHLTKHQNIPIAIVANGPSLDDDLEYLKNHQNNFITVACGTALTALDKCGIIPDFYVAVERTDAVYNSLQEVNNNQIFECTINISVPVIHPLTVGKFTNILLANKRNENIAKYFRHSIDVLNQLDDLICCDNTNPLVANCAISIFLNLNFSNLYLFGVDNGSISLDKDHSYFSCYYTNKDKYKSTYPINDSDINNVIGNFGQTVYSNFLFNSCKKHIEKEIQNHPNTKIYNCSNGAFIKGTIPIHSKDLNLNINISNHKQQYKKYLLSEGSKAVKLDQESINSIFDKQHFCETTNAICKIWKTGYDCNSKLAIIQKMKQTYDYLYSTKSEIEISALSGSLNVFFSSIIRALYIFKNQNLTIQLINTCITRVIEFLELSKDTYKNADKLVQGEHFKYEPKIVYNCWKKEKEKE